MYESSGGAITGNHFSKATHDALEMHTVTNGTWISENYFDAPGEDSIELLISQQAVGSTLIVANEFHNSTADAIQLVGQQNTDHHIFIHRNLFTSNKKAAISLTRTSDPNTEPLIPAPLPELVKIANNTFVNNNHAIIGGANSLIGNNILIGNQVAISGVSGKSLISHNMLWNNTQGVVGSSSPQQMLEADPQLDQAYKLTASSPAIDAGINEIEYDGVFHNLLALQSSQYSEYSGVAPDLGWREFDGAGNPVPTTSITPVITEKP
jgi:hypothetical protein